MNWLCLIMENSKYPFKRKPFFCDTTESNIIWHAHRLGIVLRSSHSQVHWTEKGAKLARKYFYSRR